MPRLVFEEPKGAPVKTESAEQPRETRRDNVVVALKAATFALVIALMGAAILLATAGGEPEAKAPAAPAAPAVPAIEDRNAPTSPESPAPRFVAPEVRSQTAVITPAAVPTTTTTTPPPADTPRPDRDDRFPAVGRPCGTLGAYAFTERYEPLVCAEGRGGRAVWRRVFG